MGSRRDFLRTAATLPVCWTSFTQALRAASAGPADSYWQMVRAQFPLEPGLVYLNAANVCPASRLVLDRHAQYLRDFQSNPSFQNRDKYVPLREALRARVAKLLRVAPGEIAITRNTSEGSNIIVHGITLKPGDEVILTSHNHPSNLDSWRVRARREGFSVVTVPTTFPAQSPDQLFDGIEEAVTPRTRVISVTHLTSTTGLLYPVKAIGELARRRRIYYHLDGAQTFGALDVDLSAIGCDSFSASAHKWPMGPLEAGILYVRASRVAEIWPSIVTAGWSDDISDARKFEVYGQRDDPRVAALDPAVEFLTMIGMPRVEARIRELATRAKNGLREIPGVVLRTNIEPELSAGVVKFNLQRLPVKEAYDRLYAKHRLAIALTASGESEGLRFSPHIYNAPEEIDQAVEAVRGL